VCGLVTCNEDELSHFKARIDIECKNFKDV
jgi:hypothetical protein